MRLSDRDIKQALLSGRVKISPAPAMETIEGVSVDLHLASDFRVFSAHKLPYLDLSQPHSQIDRMLEEVMGGMIALQGTERLVIHPGELILAATQEIITLPDDLVGWLDGRSSLARLGLMVHVTAHRIDPGWHGQIVLECYNSGRLPLALAPGMKIAAINFETTSSPVEHPYQQRRAAKYKNQRGAAISKFDTTIPSEYP